MNESMNFDYYYGIEAEQFSFYRVPRLLIKDERFKGLSSDAKLLYGLMLDRMSLSMKNGWLDEENRAYIVYTVDAVMEDLGCSKPTCIKIMKELDTDNGIGLIEKKRIGLGRPDIIYVKNFATLEKRNEQEIIGDSEPVAEVKKADLQKENSLTSRSKEILLQEVKEADHQRLKNLTSGSKEVLPAEVKEFAPNYTNTNHTDFSYTEESYINPIYQSKEPKKKADGIDEIESYKQLIRQNIEYDLKMQYLKWDEKAQYQELYEIICEVVCYPRDTIRIGSNDYPYHVVKSMFLKLNSSHLEYVIGCLKETTTKIGNIKAYLVTALYNAPLTMNHYYQQEVQHDMYGGGWHEKGII